jgi:hypothetical protein
MLITMPFGLTTPFQRLDFVKPCLTHGSSACRRSIRLSVLVARINAASPVKSEYFTQPSRYPSTAWTKTRWLRYSSDSVLLCSAY